MNRLLLVLLALPFAFLGTSQALAQSSLKGQGRAFTGAGIFSLSADARGSRGGAGGSFRYDRKANGALEELVVVAVANCLWTSLDGTRAVVSGQAEVRSNPAGLATKEWFYIGIQDAGPTEKNRASTGFVSMAEGLDICQKGLASFPAMVDVGDFVITRNVDGSGAGGTASGNLTAPPFDGALYLPFDGNASPGQIVTKPGATPPIFVPGKYGQAIFFSDSSAVAVPLKLSPIDTPQITITAWIKRAPRSGIGKIIGASAPGYPVLQIYGGNPKVLRGGAGRDSFNMTPSGTDIEPNQWTFVAGVFDYDMRTIRLHVDGKVQLFNQSPSGDSLRMNVKNGEVSIQGEVVGPDGVDGYYVTIGANEFRSFGGVLKGYAIDDVRIYTRALSEQTVAGLASGSSTATPASGSSRFANIPILGDPVGKIRPTVAGSTSITFPDVCKDRLGVQVACGDPKSTQWTQDDQFDPSTSTYFPGEVDEMDRFRIGETEKNTPDFLPNYASSGSTADDLQEVNESALPSLLEKRNARPREWRPDQSTASNGCTAVGSSTPRIQMFGQFPAAFITAAGKARDCRVPITSVVLTADDQWVIATEKQNWYSDNLPAGMSDAIERFSDMGRSLDAAAISANNQWLVAAGDEFEQQGLRQTAKNELQTALRRFKTLTSFSFDPSDSRRWTMVLSDGTISGDLLPQTLRTEISRLAGTQRKPHDVAYTTDRGWILLTNDLWHATNKATQRVVDNLNNNRLNNRRIDQVVFYRDDKRYLFVSNGPEPRRPGDPVWVIENSFAAGHIWKRMKALGITGLSIAMVRNNQIAWARGYGLRVANFTESYVHPDTIFNAASISKPVAAFGLLQLVDQGKLDLHKEGELEVLRRFYKRPNREKFNKNVRPEASNIVQLLQHCAGFEYAHGGSGSGKYSLDADLPVLSDSILGVGNAKSGQKVMRVSNSGVSYKYSGANFVLVQALIDAHTGGFLTHMGKLLRDLKMLSSTYVTPPDSTSERYAFGHLGGVVQPTTANPELAPGSLTTTASDLARFVIAINKWGDSLLSPELTRKFIGRSSDRLDFCRDPGEMALGIKYSAGNGRVWGATRYWHGGLQAGYRTYMIGFPLQKSGLVVLMSTALRSGDTFRFELSRGVARAYGL
ncbi:MAG: serine hydrolase [Gammaproteobacteria bacterium]|nr:serine hydrolase [Gammaproteobacteria bacterium]